MLGLNMNSIEPCKFFHYLVLRIIRSFSLIKLECGFDEKFFNYKKKKNILSNEQKHRMLLFDEIITEFI